MHNIIEIEQEPTHASCIKMIKNSINQQTNSSCRGKNATECSYVSANNFISDIDLETRIRNDNKHNNKIFVLRLQALVQCQI